jgi:hypothetical protein
MTVGTGQEDRTRCWGSVGVWWGEESGALGRVKRFRVDVTAGVVDVVAPRQRRTPRGVGLSLKLGVQ